MATIIEIAKMAGVSIGTVDRVLHNRGYVKAETRTKVEKAMEQLNYEPNRVAQGLAVMKKKLRFLYMTPRTLHNPFFIPVKQSAEKKIQQLKAYGVETDMYDYPEKSLDEDKLLKKLSHEIGKYDGACILGKDSSINKLIADEAKKRPFPIVFYNSKIEGIDSIAYVGCDYVASGRLAAGLAAMTGGVDSKVCFFSEFGSIRESADERIHGFLNEADIRYPDMKILGKWDITSDKAQNKRAVRQMLKKAPETNVVYVINPMDYSICRIIAAEDKENKIKIITNDLVPIQYDMFRDGIISATICQEPEKQGALPLEILFNYLAYGISPNKVNYTELSIHIEQNI